MGKRSRKLRKREAKQRISARLRGRSHCGFGRWEIPKRMRVTGWKHLAETIRDEER